MCTEGVTAEEWAQYDYARAPGRLVCRRELSSYCFLQRFTALSTYFYSSSFLSVLLHYSFFSVCLRCPPHFGLYCTISVLQFLLSTIHANSKVSWVAIPSWEAVSAGDTQGRQLLFHHQALPVFISPHAMFHSPCFWN